VTPIYHITTELGWETARRAGAYAADTLESEGFIHCSTAEQWPRVLRERFAGRDHLVLLEIDPERAGADVRWENLEGGEEPFPHLYGPLDIGAVVSARRL
jgi:uncharacterized protein (DUF952 family)